MKPKSTSSEPLIGSGKPTTAQFWIIFNAGVLCVLAIDLFAQTHSKYPKTAHGAR
jgi:hypothetical protein